MLCWVTRFPQQDRLNWSLGHRCPSLAQRSAAIRVGKTAARPLPFDDPSIPVAPGAASESPTAAPAPVGRTPSANHAVGI